jgi:hypothetical protein
VTFNDEVWVALNEEGLRIWRDYWACLGLPPKSLRIRVQAGWTRFQLWEVAQIFGPTLYNGQMRLPFRTLEIRLVPPGPFDKVRPCAH